MGLRAWLKRRRVEKQARQMLRALFTDGRLLRGTSLRPRHSSRSVFLGFEARDEELTLIRFGILRHPRPYAFSRQSHEVIEYYSYDPSIPLVKVEEGLNLTRLKGQDACD